jgi:hypothetical protein
MADTLLSVGVLDDAGATKRANIFLPGTMTLAQVQGWSDVYQPLLDAVVDGKLTDAQVTFNLTMASGLKGAPVADSTVRRGADFTFLNPSRYKWPAYIPAWSLTYIVAGDIDIAPTPVDDFLSGYIDGLVVSSVTYQPLNGSGFDLTALSKSKEAFRK